MSVADAVWVHVIRIDAAHALALVVVHAIDERAFVSWLSRIKRAVCSCNRRHWLVCANVVKAVVVEAIGILNAGEAVTEVGDLGRI